MSHNRQSSVGQTRIPRPTTPSDDLDDVEITSTQTNPKPKVKHLHWTDEMDGHMIASLLNQLLSIHKRSDNGFTALQVSKAVDSVFNGCGIVVTAENVRARLKTLKKVYLEVRELLNVSSFGINSPNGRITADPIAWEQLVKERPQFNKWKTKLCPRYDDFEAIFGNDSATGDRAVTGFDISSPMHVNESANETDPTVDEMDPSTMASRKRPNEEGSSKEGSSKVKRRCAQPLDESALALAIIAESSKEIANALKAQATVDTLSHVNWQLILQKLQGMDLDNVDAVRMMKKFQNDKGLALMFMSSTDEAFNRTFVFMELGRDPPQL